MGKSTVAAALAFGQAQAKKTLLVELGSRSFYRDFLGLPQVVYQPQKTPWGFDISLWSGEECLKEYAKHLLKIESLYRIFFENKVTKSLIQAAPGLPELAMMGKITSGPPRNIGPRLPYELMIIDGLSTGHFLPLVQAPKALADVVSFGPMGEQSRSIDRVLHDAHHVKYVLVTLPEELPLKEGLEFETKLSAFLGWKPTWVINKRIQFADTEVKGVNSLQRIDNHQTQSLQKFIQADQALQLPFIFSHQIQEILGGLAPKLGSICES